MTSAFTGFPQQAFDFYERLAANNTKPWWNEHRGEYDEFVKAPLVALADELSSEFGTYKLFRPYNDQRFSAGDPIKTHQGATVPIEDAVGYYVQVSAEGLMTAGGWYSPGGDQVRRYREAVDGAAGAELQRMVTSLRRTFDVEGNQLATRPRGVDPNHPRLDLMRNRMLTVARTYPVDSWLSTRKAFTVVRKDWRAMRPMLEWLADRVGPLDDPGR